MKTIDKNIVIGFVSLILIILGITGYIAVDGLLSRMNDLEQKTESLESRRVEFSEVGFTSTSSQDMFVNAVYMSEQFIKQQLEQQAKQTMPTNPQ